MVNFFGDLRYVPPYELNATVPKDNSLILAAQSKVSQTPKN